MKNFLHVILIAGLSLAAGCGYTTRSTLPGHFRTIYIDQFKNRVNFTTESNRNLYFPLIEVDIRNAISDRFLFDGNLRVAKSEAADLVLKGELLNYERNVLRYTDSDDPQEYRIQVTVSLELWDTQKNEVVWTEPQFTGEATYFVSGAQSRSESAAVKDAVVDLSRRIVERTIEDW